MQRTIKTQFYTYSQNNSGGYFIQNDNVRAFLVIEAPNAEEAKRIAEGVTENYSQYCSCCGERWYFWEDEGHDKPMYCGQDLREHLTTDKHASSFGKSAVIYNYDGTREYIECHTDIR